MLVRIPVTQSGEHDVRDTNALSGALAEGNHVPFEVLSLIWIHPALWDEALRVWEDVFIMVHKYTCHANRCLCCIVSVMNDRVADDILPQVE
jgi:hypothetical protein